MDLFWKYTENGLVYTRNVSFFKNKLFSIKVDLFVLKANVFNQQKSETYAKSSDVK